MKMYVAVVDGGSFAAAADKLEVSRAMVSKQVQKLEEHLGTRLLNRTTRLARHGTPRTPADLAGHACLGYTLTAGGADWRFEGADGPVVVPIAGPIRADNGDIIRLAALAGAGVLFQPRYIVGDDPDAGKLVRVRLPPYWQSAESGVYAVYPSRKHLSAKVRSFVDFVAAAIRP